MIYANFRFLGCALPVAFAAACASTPTVSASDASAAQDMDLAAEISQDSFLLSCPPVASILLSTATDDPIRQDWCTKPPQTNGLCPVCNTVTCPDPLTPTAGATLEIQIGYLPAAATDTMAFAQAKDGDPVPLNHASRLGPHVCPIARVHLPDLAADVVKTKLQVIIKSNINCTQSSATSDSGSHDYYFTRVEKDWFQGDLVGYLPSIAQWKLAVCGNCDFESFEITRLDNGAHGHARVAWQLFAPPVK